MWANVWMIGPRVPGTVCWSCSSDSSSHASITRIVAHTWCAKAASIRDVEGIAVSSLASRHNEGCAAVRQRTDRWDYRGEVDGSMRDMLLS
jgi:hypothetical protein